MFCVAVLGISRVEANGYLFFPSIAIPTLNDKGLAGKELYWGPFSPGGGVGDSD